MRFTVFGIVVALLGGLGAGCKSDVKYYCDEDTPCLPRYSDRPYCDLTGEYEPDGVSNTCVANPFDASGPDGSVSIDGGTVDAGNDDAMMPPDATVPPEIVVSATSQDFGSVVEGQTSAGVSFTISNIGGSPSGTLSVATSGTNAADFTTSGDCQGATLQPASDCTVTVTFAPQGPGSKTAELDVSATPGGDLMVALSGDALALGSLSMTPTAHTFSNTNITATSSTQSFTVTNNGGSTTGTLAVSLSNTTDFAISTDNCDGTTLTASATCQVIVRFKPSVVGSRLGSLVVQANPGGQVSASVGGTGTASISVSKTGSGASGGTVTSNPAGITCGGTCSAEFSATSVTLSASTNSNTSFAGWSGAGCSGVGNARSPRRQIRASRRTSSPTNARPKLLGTRPSVAQATHPHPVSTLVLSHQAAPLQRRRVQRWGHLMYGTHGLEHDNIGQRSQEPPFYSLFSCLLACHTCACSTLSPEMLYAADGQLGYDNLNIGHDPGTCRRPTSRCPI